MVAPELALLAALQHIIELTTATLVAIHPEIVGDRSNLRPLDLQVVLADQLITLGGRLANATHRYRVAALAVVRAPDTDPNDVPF